jgi:hypothetical protein
VKNERKTIPTRELCIILYKTCNSKKVFGIIFHFSQESETPPQMEELFRPIEGFPNYVVGDQGSIVNIRTERVMRQTKDLYRDRYIVGLTHNRKQYVLAVASIVAMTFLPPPEEPNLTILHRDGNRANNAAWNLVWKPRWFVVCYMKEMRYPRTHREQAFVATNTGQYFETIGIFCAEALVLPFSVARALDSRSDRHNFGVYGTLVYC